MNKLKMLSLILLAVTVFGCSDLSTQEDAQQRVPPRAITASEKKLAESSNTFAFQLLQVVNQHEAGKNLFISPFSISMALGMTLNGANGTTKDAMQQTLTLNNLTIPEINESYKSLLALQSALDPKVTFQIANSIWYTPILQVEQEFVNVNKEFFDAEVTSLNFSDPAAAKTINAWVDQKTKSKIKSIVPDPIPNDIVMYLINAIYFKGTWTYEFKKEMTADDLFTLSNGVKKTVKMMYQKGGFKYFHNDLLQAVDLPYGYGDFSMTILLPHSQTTIDNLLAQLTQQHWDSWINSFSKLNGEIFLPKFKLEYEKKLNDILKSMGMAIAFNPDLADFTKIGKPINQQGNLFISEVRHKTFVQVDEEGTEAAAATSVGTGVTSVGDGFVMRVDRPFFFALRENHSGTILFMGKIVEPASE